MNAIEEVAGAVTAVTGFEKGSGKTTFLNFALPYARRAGPVALFTIGVDGALKAGDGGPGGEIRVEPGDLVLTTEAFARASSARFELLEAPRGRTALGPLLLGRARRAGSITLVGPEHLGTLAELIERVRLEGWAASVLVDGAGSRTTQVNALGDVQFVFCARVDPASLARTAARIRALAALAALPTDPDPGPESLRLEGPVSAATLKALADDDRPWSVADFTKFFLEPAELLRVLERRPCSLRRRLDLLCCAVAARDLDREQVLAAVGEPAAAHILFNPHQAAV
jgi:hypothetical protein